MPALRPQWVSSVTSRASEGPASNPVRQLTEASSIFSILPISDPATRSLEGWVDVASLKLDVEAGRTADEAELSSINSEALKCFPKKTQAYTGACASPGRRVGEGGRRWG